ncbi:MAG: YbaB/EbfC family nucleoid-associated protein [Deltaproteobacteria bacterium]|jgi:DNA-binding YbaB/EbfC family protein|nr:YbaB/EbfC family nucleoid-associated protein [Deltaproteobacteria bacterium]
MFKGLGDLKALMEQAKNLQESANKIKADLEKKDVSASSGAGLVTVTVTGTGKFKEIIIDKTIINPDDVEMLQDLVLSAINAGIKKSKELLKEEMSKLAGGMPLPSGFDDL